MTSSDAMKLGVALVLALSALGIANAVFSEPAVDARECWSACANGVVRVTTTECVCR